MLSKRTLKSTRFFKPYIDGKPTLKSTGTGTYIIKKKDKVLYVGMATTDIKATLYRHFQTWTDNRAAYTRKAEPYARITYKGENLDLFLIKVIYTPTGREASIIEQLLIRKLKPRDNEMKAYLYKQLEFLEAEEKLDNSKFISAYDEEPPF